MQEIKAVHPRTLARRAIELLWIDAARIPFNLMANSVAGSAWMPRVLRTAIYRACGVRIAYNAVVRPGVFLVSNQLTVGRNTSINARCVFDNEARVWLGERVGVGPGVHFLTVGHDTENPNQRSGPGIWKEIRVGDGVLIGAGCQVLPGVSVGDGCVIAAGSVVNRSCEPHGLYGGVPARRLRDLEEG